MKTVTVQLHDNYALALLKDLQKAHVLTILPTVNEAYIVPEWQQKLVLDRIELAKVHPEQMLNWEDVKDTF